MTRLFADMLKDALNEFAYDATLAGLSYTCGNSIYGVDVCELAGLGKSNGFTDVTWRQFSCDGYHDKLSALLMTLIERMLTLQLDPARFVRIKDVYRRGLQNFKVSFKQTFSQLETKYFLFAGGATVPGKCVPSTTSPG